MTAGRSVWLAPHRFLHQAPLELATLLGGQAAALKASIVPAMSVASSLPARRAPGPGYDVAIGGDPTTDLPFARLEARLVAGDEATSALGTDCDADWLRAATANRNLGVLHLACHGRFDRNHPERSGLLLAGDPETAPPDTEPQQLVTADEIAALELKGVVVVLSACSSGLETISIGDETAGLLSAFLRAGATAIVAARWPIDDLAAMLLMYTFHDRLRAGSADLHDALATAATDLRELSAVSLCQRGFALADEATARGGTTDEAVRLAAACVERAAIAMGDNETAGLVSDVIDGGGDAMAGLEHLRPQDGERAHAAKPFADPRHWGAFSIIGRGHEQWNHSHR